MIRRVLSASAIWMFFSLGCSSSSALTPAELRELDAPPPAVTATVDRELALVRDWYSAVGEGQSAHGRSLTSEELREASALGITHPENVRVVITDTFPLPEQPEAKKLARALGLGSSAEGGRTHVATIFVKKRYASAAWLLRHELVHVGQIERMGVDRFLRRYLTELRVVGYARAPLEVEANRRSRTELSRQ